MLIGDSNVTILFEGRAEVVEGYAEVLGCPVKKLETRKLTPLYLKGGAVEVEGFYIKVNGSTIPDSWMEIVEEIESNEWRRIFLLGDTDTGKSSLAVWLINKLKGKKCVIDADIGQADVAHPGAMGMGTALQCPLLSDMEVNDGFFVGTTSPMRNETRCLTGFARLSAMAKGDWIIVDTTGWMRGKRARNYKLAKLEIFRPDVVICMGSIPYYLDGYNAIAAESFVPKKRSRELRSAIRSERYAKWLENAELVTVNAREVKIGNTTLFKGRRLRDEVLLEIFNSFVFAELGSDFLNLCMEKEEVVGMETIKTLKEVYGVEDVNIFTSDCFFNLAVGIYSSRYEGIGLIKSIDFESRKIDILTRTKDILSIEFGEFRIEDGKEIFTRVP